jgi:hypothetical protein
MNIERHALTADGSPDTRRSPASLNSCRLGGVAGEAPSASAARAGGRILSGPGTEALRARAIRSRGLGLRQWGADYHTRWVRPGGCSWRCY